MSTETIERAVALGQHHIETAAGFWRTSAVLVEREPYPRRHVYERAVAAVGATLADVTTIPQLLSTYNMFRDVRMEALARACALDTDGAPDAGIVEDCAFWRRYQALARQHGYHPPA